MSKTKTLFQLIMYVNSKRRFTAEDVAHEFQISIRTAHRYLLELSEMGVPLYTEPGRNGGYRILDNRMLPPLFFNENEAFAIFFAFQSLKYYKSLPFEIDMESVSRKLHASLPPDTRSKVDQLEAVLSFWNKKREASSPFLREIIEAALENRILAIQYQSARANTHREVAPLGVYAYDGFWYMPAMDLNWNEIRVFRLDRILELNNTGKRHNPGIRLNSWLENQTVQEPREPLRLYAELNREGIRKCMSQPWLEPHINVTDEDHGCVELEIDQSEIAFVSAFFLQLGPDAKVIRPQEVIDTIRQQLHATIMHYASV